MALEQLGPYRIVRLLGRGGMGSVYEGAHQESGERVALKILAPAYADDEAFRGRFAAEIEALKLLRHPNIVRLIGFGEQDGTLFYAMELVEGQSLQEQIRGGKRLPWREVAEIAIQVASALKHAHDSGIIHRDLKPANLLRTPQGLVKLTDFGIAKLFGAAQLTSAGGVIGTIDYMSPEQAEGQGVTARSDLYSLGAVMYALLAGRPPFAGRTPTEIFHKLRHQSPPPLRTLQCEVPPPMEELIMELLERDPQKRVPTALVLSKRLRAMLHALDAVAEQQVPTEPAPPSAAPKQASPKTGARPVTEIDATRELSPSEVVNVSWENETVFTAGSQVPVESAEDSELKLLPETPTAPSVGPLPAAAKTVGAREQTRATRRFTAVTEQTSRARWVLAGTQTRRRTLTWEHYASIGGIVVVLILLAGLAWYFQLPPSAETLFRRIDKVVASVETGDYMDAREDIDRFLSLYPDDPRAAQVRRWQAEHDAYRFWRSLERQARKAGGIEYLSPVQRDFVLAMREEARDPKAAARQHEQLISTYQAQADASDEVAQCVKFSRLKAAYLNGQPPTLSDHDATPSPDAAPPASESSSAASHDDTSRQNGPVEESSRNDAKTLRKDAKEKG